MAPFTRKAVIAGLLVLAAIVSYRGVTQCEFVGFDDDLYVYDNPHVVGGFTREGVAWAFSSVRASTWQPMVWLSLMGDAELYAGDPAGYHRTNLMLHILTVLFVFLAWQALTGRSWSAAAVAALLAVHPVHVESVAWVAERKDVLSALFWWGAILAYAFYVRRPGVRRALPVLVCFLLGVMAKPMVLTLPAVLLLLDAWPLGRLWRNPRRCVAEKVVLLPVSVASVVLTYYVQSVGGSVLGTAEIPFWGRVSNAVVSYGRYVGKLVWPHPLSLLYPHPGGWPWVPTLAVGLALVAVLGVAYRLRHGFPAFLFGMCWFLGTLLPVIGLVQIGWHAMADRFLYIPAVGLYVAMVWCVGSLLHGRGRLIGAAAFCGWLLVLSLVTTRQVGLWRNNERLFSHAVETTRDNWVMQNCLGAALVRQGRAQEAITPLARSIETRSDRPKAYYNLGCALMALQRYDDAATRFAEAAERWPGNAKPLFNEAVALAMAGKRAAAIRTYEQLLTIDPSHVQALNNLAALQRQEGQLDAAIASLRKALLLAPDYLSARYNLGVFLLESGATREAANTFAQLLKDHPEHAGAKQGLRVALARLRQGK